MLAALSGSAYALSTAVLSDLDGSHQGEPDSSPAPFSSEARSAQLADVAAGIAALADFETPAPTATATATPSPTPAATEVPPTPTEPPPTPEPPPPTETAVPPTETPLPPTETPVPPTATPPPPTPTPEPPAPTPTPEPPTPEPTLDVPSDIPLLGRFVPTATPSPTATRAPSLTPDPDAGTDGLVAAKVTRYADSLEGNSMACGGEFDQDNPFIVAVSLAYDTQWPCGTPLEVCGPAGCLTAIRTDTCPGCPGADIDMTRAGVEAVCGNQSGCDVVIRMAE